MKDKDVVCLVVYQQTDSQCTVRYADAEGGRPRLLLGLQVYFPASSGFTWEMMSEPSIRILTLRFRSLEREKEEVELASIVLMIPTAYTTTYTTVQKFGVSKIFIFFSKDTLNCWNMTVKPFRMLQNIYISVKRFPMFIILHKINTTLVSIRDV